MSHVPILIRLPNHLRVLHLATFTSSNFIVLPVLDMPTLHIDLVLLIIFKQQTCFRSFISTACIPNL